jgi:hypothetical protein
MAMNLPPQELETRLAGALRERQIADSGSIAWAASWLEACGYQGLRMLAEALADDRRGVKLARDNLGFDLDNVSCVFLAPAIIADVRVNGRVFLRNVRHGLYLLPFTVRDNLGIGCPVDPSFAVGGERHKNPYAEKLALAEANGLVVDEVMLNAIQV